MDPKKKKKVTSCKICTKDCKSNENALQCDMCDYWIHMGCDGMSKDAYDFFGENNSFL